MTLSIQTTPALRSPIPLAIGSLLLGGIAGSVISQLDDPLFGGSWILAVLVSAAAIFVLAAALLALFYPSVSYDPESGQVRIGLRSVPVESITRAWRTISSSAQAGYLVYRLAVENGPSARLIVVGSPLRGLTAAQLENLARLVADAPIALPPSPERAGADVRGTAGAADAAGNLESPDVEGLSIEQQRVAANLLPTGGRVAMTSAALLREILGDEEARGRLAQTSRGADSSAPESLAPPTLSEARITEAEAEVVAADWLRDDEGAVRLVEALPPGPRIRRRAAFWVVTGLLLLASFTIVLLVLEENGAELPQETLTGVFLVTLLAAFPAYLVWCALADAHVRQMRQAGREWVAAADPAVRRRGMPEVFHPAWMQSRSRLNVILSFTAAVIGMGTVIAGPLVWATAPGYELTVGLPLTLAGIALSWAAIAGYRGWVRRKREDVAELVRLAGWRATPPQLREG